jgi:hypothetical protein
MGHAPRALCHPSIFTKQYTPRLFTMDTIVSVCIDRKTAAKISGMSISWLRHMDAIGAGAPKLRLGAGPGRIRYEVESFMAWLKQHADPARAGQETATT